ncbi:hypothetical protein [Aquiflexum sp.]|uniref:hypothetical protein n=1 Tax=Aquiflexum sp. TaxID=1872584 RepID=UPI0035939076
MRKLLLMLPILLGLSFQAEATQECTTTDYWIHTSSGEWIHIYFTICIEPEQ